jgi:hypothetical protein
LYRTSGAVIEEIVLERRSRPRVRPTPAILVSVAFASVAATVMIFSPDHWGATNVVIGSFALVALVAMFIRTRRLTVVRAGRELRVREGRLRESVLVGEVMDVDIDTRGERAHAVVFVLRDGRRVPIGAPREFMDHAASDRRAIREALLR